jgi:hypothetical protein
MIRVRDLGISLAVGLLVFVVATQILGVPLWWVFRNLVPLSGVSPDSKFKITVSPEVPAKIGDSVMIVVRNDSSNMPVANVKLSIKRDGNAIQDYYTDSNGQEEIEYLGEVTVITASKSGFKTVTEAIPTIPDSWRRNENNSIISAVVGASIEFVLGRIFTFKKNTRKRVPAPSR